MPRGVLAAAPPRPGAGGPGSGRGLARTGGRRDPRSSRASVSLRMLRREGDAGRLGRAEREGRTRGRGVAEGGGGWG